MLAPAVVALEVVLQQDLPVGLDVVGLAEGLPEVLGPGRDHVRGEGLERRSQCRGRGLGQADEDQPVPDLDVRAMEAPVRVVEVRAVGRPGDVDQAPVEPVRPLVVRADEPPDSALRLLAEAVAAVPARVEEGVQDSGAVSDHDEALPGHLVDDVVAGVCELRLVADERPLPEEDAPDLGLEDLLGHVGLARQPRRRCGRSAGTLGAPRAGPRPPRSAGAPLPVDLEPLLRLARCPSVRPRRTGRVGGLSVVTGEQQRHHEPQ